MARYIYCDNCKDRMKRGAESFNEVFESIRGKAIVEARCDSCDKKINIGNTANACMLMPHANHPNEAFQKPEVWASNYINYQK